MSDKAIFSKDALFKSHLPEEVVEVEGLDHAFRVRSISRADYVRVRTYELENFETAVLAAGLVEPELSEDEVRELRTVLGPKPFDDLVAEVLRVSGMRQTAVEEAKRSFPEDGGS